MTSEPTRTIEVERKYDVDDDTPLVDLVRMPGVAAVGEPELRELDAVYLDTSALTLASARVAVRRRSGGPDEGWHVKFSAADGRHEYGWPLGDEALPAVLDQLAVPEPVREAVSQWCADEALSPLARVRNTRRAYALTGADGALVAELVDDRVTASDVRGGSTTSWREWEVELGPAAPGDPAGREAFFAAVDAAVAAVGGRPASSESKLQRALGR
ncbi:CYTH domain-containing protein [Microbacterium sp. LRZ72]|uniref:CYTH domain-containing protein n=1 Tax=Microbacterium sp. LRZ72 TaxID=2942481 RepID=UPI0029AFF610|nr:CYTH domain-containing protein [Microbacterium sp. LRZ72]MDX2377145.1 CYTH domain-containing protein [Microbacterium sp. LRZ72]